MRLALKILVLVVAVVAVAVLYVVGSTIYFFKTKQSDREVATGVDVSGDWVEISAQPPLKATKQVQHLILTVDGYNRSLEDTRNQLPLADSTLVSPEVEIADERGMVYRLHPSRLISSGVGYTTDSSLLRDKSFTKIRIRCDKPFRVSRIVWENENLK
jgi:hypothetical protein